MYYQNCVTGLCTTNQIVSDGHMTTAIDSVLLLLAIL
jgi:hypothetical protein